MEKVILLADKNSNSWNFARKIQKYLFEEKGEQIPLEEVEINLFRNKEIQMHVPENVRKKEVYFIHDSTKDPQQWWVELILLKDLLLNSSAESINLVLPNILYSRQDRKDRPHVPISARALAISISSGIKRIITMDLHAPQVQGFYPEIIPFDNLYSFPALARYLFNSTEKDTLKNLVILSPDAGGVHRAQAFANRIGSQNPVAFVEKQRKVAGEVAEMHLVGNIQDKDILIVDDILDSGNTLCKAATLLKEKGARKLWCYATHGIFTKGTTDLLTCFEKVMTSNTHYHENHGIEVIDVSSIFAEAIYRAQKGLSISKLFE